MDPFTWIFHTGAFRSKCRTCVPSTDTELRDVCRLSSEDRVRLNVTEVLLTDKQSNAGQCVHEIFLWKPGFVPVVLWTDHMTACCVGVLGLGSGSRVHVDYIWFLLFLGPSSSALFLPLWVHFKHETLPLVSGLTRGRPSLYLFTTRSLYRPVHTWYSGSLHHFRLVKLLAQIIATSRKHDHRTARPFHTSTVEHVLTSGSDIFWSWSSSRRFSGSDSFTATGTCGNIQTRGGAKTHISMITMVTLSYVKLQVHCEGFSDVSRCRTCERSPVHMYDSWTSARYLETSSGEVTYFKQLNPEDTRTFKLFSVINSVK